MSDSDSGSESLDCGELRSQTQHIFGHDVPILTVHPSEDTYRSWNNIPIGVKFKHVQLLKMSSFWLPIVLRRQRLHTTTRWALHIGIIDSIESDLDVKQLSKIEVIESVLRALDRGCVNLDRTRQLIWISNNLNLHVPEVLDDALQWLQSTGEPNIIQRILDLGPNKICFVAIQYIFAEYSQFVQSMAVNVEGLVKALTIYHTEANLQKSENMKMKGNQYFQKNEYDAAIRCYTRALAYTPENYMVYGNRALCYIRCENYLKAVGDGKRATLIEPLWAKGHYRYCEALFNLREHRRAIDANAFAQMVCIQTSDGLRDLVQQHKRFLSKMTEKAGPPKEIKNTRQGIGNKTNPAPSAPPAAPPPVKVDTKPASGKVPHVKGKKTNQVVKEGMSPVNNTKLSKQQKSGTEKCKTDCPKVITKSKNEKEHSNEKKLPKSAKTSIACIAALRSAVQDGCIALADLRCWPAEKAFSQALALLQATTAKDIGISTLDEAVLHYGRASALIEIGQSQELGEALREFGIIKSFEKRAFECLVYYGTGRVYFKENRFKDALAHFTDSMQMFNKRKTPGELNWPLTKEVVKETKPDYFKTSLLEFMESCKFPPMPDAICRHGNCIGHIKTAIYFTDPDFKGFIRLVCCHGCVVEYHISCWKSLKTTSFFDSNEKDFLQRDCFTPDCKSPICSIHIYGSTGQIKCKFETIIKKPERQKKVRVNQKCTSLKKLRSKEERKLRRRQNKQAPRDANIPDCSSRPEEQGAAREERRSQGAGPSALPLHRDRVLFQMEQSQELLRGHRCGDLAALVARLKPWVELDSSRGNGVAARFLSMDPVQVETLGQIVDLLLERRNRVWARVFTEFLGGSLKWAEQLDNEGLNAASVFIETYAGHLEEMDPASLLKFAPLQDVLVKKFDSRPELLSLSGTAVIEYLKHGPPQDVRVFIWTLEEHRDQYDHYHTMLDEFFEILDGDCLIMKKSDNVNENSSPVKTRNRGRKRKPRDQRATIVLSGMRGGMSRHERHEREFIDEDEDTISYFHSNDPFSVPDHLRDQVASFESNYNPPNHKTTLDDNPDPTEGSLYEYFAQILEEHGPLEAQDPLLVGQLDNFPPEARRTMEQCGGLRAFLLRSRLFAVTGEHVGLAGHAATPPRWEGGRSLDDLDVLPYREAEAPAGDPFPYGDRYEHLLALPSPYLGYAPWPAGGAMVSLDRISGDYWPRDAAGNGNHVAHSSGSDSLDFDLYSTEVYPGDMAVDTENECDLSSAPQTNGDLEETMRALVKRMAEKDLQHKRTVASLEKAIEETNTNTRVTNKEVELFQRKLEEMVRRDQKEKKTNQEELKGLKMEIEDLAGKQSGLLKSLQEKKKEYDKQLTDFCDLSNQSAAEKMSLEDEIQRCQDLTTKAAARSQKAELSILENTQKQSLYCLQKSLSDSREILLKLEAVAPRYPPHVMAIFQQRWRSCVLEATEKISMVESLYQEQMEQVKKGVRLSALPQVCVPNAPEPPVAVTFSSIQKLSFTEAPQASYISLAPKQHQAAAEAQACGPPPAAEAPAPSPIPALPSQRSRAPEPQHFTKFDRVLEQLSTMFPDYNRQDLVKFVQTFRRANGGALNSVTFQDLINSVSQIILDHQGEDYTGEPLPAGGRVWQQNGTSSTREAAVAPPPGSHAWAPLEPAKHCHVKALNVEDPCIICHDEMPPESVCVLQCRHSFHRECINSWLKEQSTCPTCRKHALIPEDFPMLVGRRHAGRPAPSFS